jgi:hypothetical protein
MGSLLSILNPVRYWRKAFPPIPSKVPSKMPSDEELRERRLRFARRFAATHAEGNVSLSHGRFRPLRRK